jgi:DNA polymerase
MTILHIDFETRSAADLKEVGLDNYARDPSTDVWCMAYSLGDGPIWLAMAGDGFNLMSSVAEYVRGGGTVVAHNAAFELEIWNNVMVPRYGWPELKPEQCECTQALAYAMAIPGSLERAAAAVGIKQQKDMAGHRLMLQMRAPKEIRRHVPKHNGATGYEEIIWHDEPDKLARLYEYCRQDVEVERELYKRLVPLSKKERRVWQLDYKINRRGIQVDLPAVKAASEMVLHEQDRLNRDIRGATDSVVGFTTEVARITKWVRSQGVAIDGLAKADVLDALGGELPDAVRTVLNIRKEAGRSSTAKLNKILSAAGPDGRVRGTKQYHGAGTGRWAGRTIQPDNFPRPTLTPAEVEAAIELIQKGERDKLDLLYGAPMSVAADCLRGMITASPGHDLLAGDFVGVENAVLPFLAGEEWKLQAIREQNAGTGPKVYLIAAAKIKHTTPDMYTKASPEYMLGKVSELSLGYQGGLGAFRQMETSLHLDLGLTDDQINDAKNEWRAAHPMIVKYWADCENAAMSAVLNPGKVFTAGAKGSDTSSRTASREVRYKKVGSFLWCGLPSNRAICYPYPKILEVETPWGDLKDAVTYMKVVSSSGAAKDKIIPDPAAHGDWQRVSSYGGKFAENNTQAFARDLLVDAMLRLDAALYDIVMHVHDEAVVEIPEISGPEVEAKFKELMSEAPPYTAGLPLAVEMWRGKRYRK